MKPAFNVLNDPWIPVTSLEGKQEKLGIRNALENAHHYKEVSSVSPLEEYSIYRFLGLFLMDALRPETEIDIEAILEEECFNQEVIESYLSLCEHEGVSFDLYDEERPFLQSVYDPRIDGDIKPVSVLDCTSPKGNNHTHFVHSRNIASFFEPDQAIRNLLTTYLFCTVGGRGYSAGVNAAPPYFAVIKGTTLFETLVFTLLPTDAIGIELDKPPVLWRRMEPIIPQKAVGKISWMQGMLFPTRRIQLIPNEKGQVIGTYFSPGENYVNKENWRDPYVTYCKDKELVCPLRPMADCAIWRNFCDIINIPNGRASQLLQMYRTLDVNEVATMTLYGAETDQARYLGLYRHDLSFPVCLTADDKTIEILQLSISASERLALSLKKAAEKITVLPKAIRGTMVQNYYQDCEKRFWELSDELSKTGPEKQLYIDICEDYSKYVKNAFSDAIGRLNLRAAELVQVEIQNENLNKAIRTLKKEARK